MRLVFTLILLSSLGSAASLAGQECRPATTALVLSGGGVRGLAHIGVLKVLDSLGVRPDLIVGTSMGAIVGALYASGYTAREIDSLARSQPVSEFARPFRVPSPHPWDQRLPLLYMVKGQNGFTFQTGVVDEALPNSRINVAMLRGNLIARGDFDRLPIPFRAVATDFRDRSTVVLGDGDLARAVRASSAIPLVFPPVVSNGAVLVDGGLSANVPIAEARSAGAERVIVSDVTEHPRDTLDVESPLALADQLVGFLFYQPLADLRPGDVYVRPSVQHIRSLDFSPEAIAEVLHLGSQAADSTLPRASCLPTAAPPAPTPPVKPLSSWSLMEGTRSDSVVLARMLGLEPGKSLDLDRMSRRLLRLAEAEAFRGIWLNPRPSPDGDSIALHVESIRAPRTVGGAGLAYDNELGAQAWGGVFDRRLLGTALEGSVLLSISRFHHEGVGTLLAHADGGSSHLTPLLQIRVREEDLRQFDTDGLELPSLETDHARASAGLELLLGTSWRIHVGGDLLHYGTPTASKVTTAGGSLRILRMKSPGPLVDGEVLVTDRFRALRAKASWPALHRSWSALPTVRLGWGSEGLPPQWTVPLGGGDGFPGLHLGERRGANELFGSLRLGAAVLGPMEIRVAIAAGRTWTASDSATDWIGGGRLGFGADTPAGPIELAYGVATTGRRAFYLRIGQWF